MEVLKSYYNAGIEPKDLYFYRDKEKNEIDLVIHKNAMLHPIEIKKHSKASKEDARGFGALKKLKGIGIGAGAVIFTGDRIVTLEENLKAIPVWHV
jgi:predicted AAA+ superfamily ATPase